MDTDATALGIGFVGADDTICALVVLFVQHVHPGTEKHALWIVRFAGDDGEFVDAPGEIARTAVDFTQFLFAVNIFRVLRAIAFGCCISQCLGDLRAAHMPQMTEFIAQTLPAGAGDVIALAAHDGNEPGGAGMSAGAKKSGHSWRPGLTAYCSKSVTPWAYSRLSSMQNWPLNVRASRVKMMCAASASICGLRQAWMACLPAMNSM